MSNLLMARSMSGSPDLASSQSITATSLPSCHKVLPGQKSPCSRTDGLCCGNGRRDASVSRIRPSSNDWSGFVGRWRRVSGHSLACGRKDSSWWELSTR